MKSKQSPITLRVIAALVTLIFSAAATSLAGQTTNIHVNFQHQYKTDPPTNKK